MNLCWLRLINFESLVTYHSMFVISIQIIGRLFLNPCLSCFLYLCSVCLLTPVYFPSDEKKTATTPASPSVLNSYNYSILVSVFYSRNVCVSNRNIYISHIHSKLMLLFLLVFAVRISLLLFFPHEEHEDMPLSW